MTEMTSPRTSTVIEQITSDTWAATVPSVSVVIASHDRAAWLPELLAALAAQQGAPPFEVVVADDGSPASTWAALVDWASADPLPLLALRLPASDGPSVPRNTAVAASRAPLIAFTDDDCLPDPGWLAAIAAAADSGSVAQGRTIPADAGGAGRWDRTIRIESPSGLWESCNLALRRELFDAVGGFPVLDLLPQSGRGFGEDVVMGAAAARSGGSTWVPDAVVRHRWLAGDLRSHVAGARRVRGFPALVRHVPTLRERTWHRWFLSRRSATVDLAGAGVLAAVVSRRATPLLATLPWLAAVWKAASAMPGGAPANVVPEALTDVVRCAALIQGSVETRTPLL